MRGYLALVGLSNIHPNLKPAANLWPQWTMPMQASVFAKSGNASTAWFLQSLTIVWDAMTHQKILAFLLGEGFGVGLTDGHEAVPAGVSMAAWGHPFSRSLHQLVLAT